MTATKPKLIFLWNYLEWGGAQIYFLGIIKMAAPDWDVTVVLPRASDEKLLGFIRQTEVEVEFLENYVDLKPALSFRRKLARRWSIIRSDFETFRHLWKFDLSTAALHIEAAPWQSWALLVALAVRRANLFLTFHNALPEATLWRRLLWKFRIGVVARLPRLQVFASNNDARERFRRWFPEKLWKAVKVTYTTVNPPEIDAVRALPSPRRSLREKFGIGADNFVVLCVGQFIDRKGRWVLLKAARSVLRERPDVRFLWLTSSDISNEDREHIASFGLGNGFRLIFADEIGRERRDILSFYRIADAYALPSYVEGLPVALLEAMAMGLPSISTKVYAIPEAIIDGETGLLIDAGGADQLVEAVLRLMNDDRLRERLAGAGRDRVTEHFDERVASQTAIDAYRAALSK